MFSRHMNSSQLTATLADIDGKRPVHAAPKWIFSVNMYTALSLSPLQPISVLKYHMN